MVKANRVSNSMFGKGISANSARVAGLLLFFFALQLASAQTFNTIYAFASGDGGNTPTAGLTMDAAGNFYGTALHGGVNDLGTVFKLSHPQSGWVLQPLYAFKGGNDGFDAGAGVTIGKDGSLYSTTSAGGGTNCGQGCGTVFKLQPATSATLSGLSWKETVLYRFTGGTDGGNPEYGNVVLDASGNVYGTAELGGNSQNCYLGCGVVFKLTQAGVETVIDTFTGPNGAGPYGGLIFDSAGNLYGTTGGGGTSGAGLVYELTPSGSVWNETSLYSFSYYSSGCCLFGGLTFDPQGNLYGGAVGGGPLGGGTIYELTPSNGTWQINVLYDFPEFEGDPAAPQSVLLLDSAGNVYGNASEGGSYGLGSIFKLTPSAGGWTYTDLHDFTGGNDGEYPYGNLVMDAGGNIYGTAELGGEHEVGVVWEITP